MGQTTSLNGNGPTLDIPADIGCIWPDKDGVIFIDWSPEIPIIDPEIIRICGTCDPGFEVGLPCDTPHVAVQPLEEAIYTVTENGNIIDGDGNVVDVTTTEPFASMPPEHLTGLKMHASGHEGGITISIGEEVPAGSGHPSVDADGNGIMYPAVQVPGITITDAGGNLLGAAAGTNMNAFFGVVGQVASAEIQIHDPELREAIDLGGINPDEMEQLYTATPATPAMT